MNILPSTRKEFKLIGSQAETLHRLHRRTELSETLTSQPTDRSFRGRINGNEFTLISSAIGKGAFCVMSGEIHSESGHVRVEIHKVFRVFVGIFLFFPVIAVLITAITGKPQFSPILIVVAIGQIALIRYAFIGLAFRLLSRDSLNRLRDVLDVEWLPS